MDFKPTLFKVTGSPDDSGWVQIHDFTPDDLEKRKTRGRILAVISTSKAGGEVNEIVQGREILTRLHEEYYGNLEGSAFNTLKAAVEKVAQEYSDMEEVEIATASIVEGAIYTAAYGGARVSLFRNGMLANILDSIKGDTIAASGFPKENDVLLLGTSSFYQLFPEGVIRAAFGGESLAKAQDNFAAAIHNRSQMGRIGACFICFLTESTASEDIGSEVVEEVTKHNKVKLPSVNLPKVDLIKSLVSDLLKKLPSRKIYVRREVDNLEKTGSKKTTMSVGIILIVILLISIFFGIRQKRTREKNREFEAIYQSALHKYEEAVNLSGISLDRSRELINESRSEVESIPSDFQQNKLTIELKEKIEGAKETILGEYKGSPELFVDLSLLSSGFKIDDVSANSDIITVLDKAGSRVAVIGVENKKSRVVSGPNDIKDCSRLAVYTTRVFCLSEGSVYELTESPKKVVEGEAPDDSLISAFAGNLYLLERSEGKIFRYPGSADEFGSGGSWFAPGIEIDLSDAINWSIDGAIWITFQQGKPIKLLSGNLESFDIKGVLPEMEKFDYIYTNDGLDSVYILEKGKKRVVELTKDGSYVAQYITPDFSSTYAIAVSEKEKKIIYPLEGKLFYIELKK